MGITKWVVEPGQRFGRGTVIRETRMPGNGAHKTIRGVLLTCDCGKEYQVRLQDLVPTAVHPTQSCGCLMRETASRKSPEQLARLRAQAQDPKTRAATAAANTRDKTTHGLSRTHELYNTWVSMMHRCHNPKHVTDYKNYGARGISVHSPWHDPAVFIADIERLIGPRPPGLTLDRTDNDGNYEPGNIRWATRKEQSANSRRRRPGS